jgi:arylsulfatase A-like enzyme
VNRATAAIAAVLATATLIALATAEASRLAAEHGWLADGYTRLARDAFWYRFDRTAPLALGALAAVLTVSALVRHAVPTPRELAIPGVVVGCVLVGRAAVFVLDMHVPRRPNVLLISIDTLRADRLGTYGYARPTSPMLDRRIAAAGVVFEQAWSHSPKTTPSHMTMLTSLYESVHGIGLWDRGRAPVLSPHVHTLAEVLKNAGYETAAFTAGAHVHRDRGFAQGFDVYKHGHQLRRALAFLDTHGRRPFFLFFHTYQVHDPYIPPSETIAMFARDPVPAIQDAVARVRDGVGRWGNGHRIFWDSVDPTSPRDVRFVSDLYDAGIRRMDDTTLVALLDRLDALDLARETLVVFTSDHGEAFLEHGRFLHDDLWAETLRVPLVLRLPDVLPAGRRVATPARLVDVMPTILDLCRVAVPRQAQGASLASQARGVASATPSGQASRLAPGIAVAEYPSPPGRVFQSVRSGPFTLILDGTRVQLFDRGVDPGEHQDIAGSEPARTKMLLTHLRRWQAECARRASTLQPRTGDSAGPDEDTVRRLRALGYVD